MPGRGRAPRRPRRPRPPPRRRSATPSGRRCSATMASGRSTQHHLEAEIGQALGQEALRCADQEDRLLDVAALAHQPDLLAGVLGVVARIGLVGDQVGDRGGQHGQVEVDGHPAVQVAQVVVEARPGLVRDELPIDVLAVGQTEEPVGAVAQVVGQRVDDRRQRSRARWPGLRARPRSRSPSGPEPGSTSSRRRCACSNAPRPTAPGARRSRARPRRRSRSPRRPACGPTCAARPHGPATTAGAPDRARARPRPRRGRRSAGRRRRRARPARARARPRRAPPTSGGP